MAKGWGLGPVFALEWLTTSRRWQLYAGRSLFVGVLLLGLGCVWGAHVAGRTLATISELAQVGQSFFAAIVFTQFTMVLLAAPAATAGGICLDKARGNLLQLLITDLSDAEIVLGKLAARLLPMIGLTCCTLPVLALGALLGGIDPLALAGSLLITLGLAILGSTIALTFSIWGTKPYEVLLATYACYAIWLLALPVWEFFTWLRGLPQLPRWFLATNPYILALAPYARPGTVGVGDYVGFLAATLVVSAVLLVLAIGRLRAVVVGQADRPAERRPARGVSRWRIGGLRFGIGVEPSLDENPALWYEWQRKGHSRWTGALIRLYFLLALSFSLLAIDDSIRPSTRLRGWFPGYVTAFEVAMGLPLMLIGAATVLVEERVRGSLDVLLATPLRTRSIVLAKWWIIFRQVPLLLVLPMPVAAVLSWESGRWPVVVLFVLFVVASAAAWTSVGLALSTWVPRLGRAVSAAVVLYTIAALGWPMMALTLFGYSGFRYMEQGAGLATISPFYGSFYLTVGIEHAYNLNHLLAWGLIWTIFHAAVAVIMLLATLATFDRCFGRARETRESAAVRDLRLTRSDRATLLRDGHEDTR